MIYLCDKLSILIQSYNLKSNNILILINFTIFKILLTNYL